MELLFFSLLSFKYSLYNMNIGNKDSLRRVFKEHNIDAVLHFAGFIEVEESMKDPHKFYSNNVVNSLNLLEVMLEFNVKKIIYSSSASIFGVLNTTIQAVIGEDMENKPTSVYGKTKLIVEEILQAFDNAYGLKSVCLRYFNAAGAAYDIGENHKPETHIIPLTIKAALEDKEIKIFGTDYLTRDGTCIRDYIHVLDIAEAHVLALDKLLVNNSSERYNLGTGKGYSVREVVKTVEEITGKKIKIIEDKRRLGDSPFLVADSSKIKKDLGWKPSIGLKEIVKSALSWHMSHPDGYNK